MRLIWHTLLVATLTLPIALSAQTQMVSSPAVQLRYVTVLVKDYDEALRWYTEVLGLKKVEDAAFGPGRRWLVVAGEGQTSPGIVLEVPPNAAKAERMGKETDWVFRVSDCFAFYEQLRSKGVKFIEPAKRQPWGTVQAVFEDPYGNIFVAESKAPADRAAGK
jgi:catechol 2,3-dioxygenase-like lactoylglutathione lyase family enzyme